MPRIRRWLKWSRCLVVAAAAAAVLAACGSQQGERVVGAAAEHAADLTPRIARGLHLSADVLGTGQLGSLATNLADSFGTVADFQDQAKDVDASADPEAQALLAASCDGIDELASAYDENRNVTSASTKKWEDFMTNDVETLLPDTASSIVQRLVEGYDSEAALEQIKPAAAVQYQRVCVQLPIARKLGLTQ
jgi:hypothetical protein